MASTPPARNPQQKKRRPASRARTPAAPTGQVESPALLPATDSPEALQLASADPRSAPSSAILALQRKTGNRAVARLIQAKLTVGAAHDKYEQEADQVAQQVMAGSNASAQQHSVEGEEEGLRRKPLAGSVSPLVQRHSLPPKKGSEEEEAPKEEEEEGSVQRRAAGASAAGSFDAGPQVEQKLASQAGHGQALPEAVRGEMEHSLGSDFSAVRVHTGGEAEQLNRELSAQAFTHGQDIYFGAGRYNPAAGEGKRLLAHELTHVVQQTGQVAPKRLQRKIRSPRQWWRDREKKKQESSYNIRWGQELPKTKDMAGEMIEERTEAETQHARDVRSTAAFNKATTLEVPLLVEKLDVGSFWDEILNAYNTENQAGLTAIDVIPDIQNSIRALHATQPSLDMLIMSVKMDLKKTKKDAFTIHRDRIVTGMKIKIQDLAKDKASQETDTMPVNPLYPSDQRYLKGDPKSSAKQFWSMRQTYEMTDAYLDDTQRAAFASALKQMPTLKVLLNPKSSGAGFRQNVGWKNGGNLVDGIKTVEDVDRPEGALMPGPYRLLTASAKQKLNTRRGNSKSFRAKVNTVDRLTRIMVEPELLSLVTRPNLHLHTASAIGFTSPWGFRAYATKGNVHVAYNESMNVIAHEVGHAIEHFLPLERWHDIHMLLGIRHEAAGGGKARAGATPIITSLSEGRYAGKYVTGKYTTTAYGGGNAEVISMAMEFLTKPKDALKLVDGDPQHVAIVLRAFRPNEYAATGALRPFDKFIPHKKAAPKVPPKPSPEKLKLLKARATHRNKPLPPIPVKD